VWNFAFSALILLFEHYLLLFLPARRRLQGLVVIGVCLSVCLCALCLSARYLKNGFMDHHQIWWVGAGGEPLEQVQFWCWLDSRCLSRITFPFPLTLMLATANAQVCVPLGHSSLYSGTTVINQYTEIQQQRKCQDSMELWKLWRACDLSKSYCSSHQRFLRKTCGLAGLTDWKNRPVKQPVSFLFKRPNLSETISWHGGRMPDLHFTGHGLKSRPPHF